MTTQQVKWIAALCLLAIALPLSLWLSIQLGDAPLSGLRVEGQELPRHARELASSLEERALSWQQVEIEVRVAGSMGVTRAMRERLGATLPVASVVRAVREAGRSGNPVLDLGKWWDAKRGRLNVRWQPQIDRARLAAFVESEQRRAEEPPIAGVSDGHGYTLPGRDGSALDVATALAALSRALVASQIRVELPVQRVPAPPPITIGSPDGALFDQETETVPESVPEVAHTGPMPEPAAWLPPNNNDCYHAPPQRPFCDGPRQVAAPHGPARELAASLRLGELETVSQLIRQGPRPEWVRAAGGPGAEVPRAWPVPVGKLGRGFGYVRREELKDRIHAGLDIVAPKGSPIVAARTGIVAYSDNHVRGYGNLLVIVHDNGEVTLNAHCQRIFVFAGERVARGQIVAEVGMTGLALGPHLHFELRVQGAPTDPAPLFAEAAQGRKGGSAF